MRGVVMSPEGAPLDFGRSLLLGEGGGGKRERRGGGSHE